MFRLPPFACSLVAGAGDTGNAAYSIGGTGGDALIINSAANFEAKDSYSIRLRVTDDNGRTAEVVQSITVADVNEAPAAVALGNAATCVAFDLDLSANDKVADINWTGDALEI